ncbi:hypothetical protein ABI59_17575 [Acidobacteria bacterium Mor1]|nr:hypothetical protein ABI59_17575 [Acidobacteria bacterium Mor1]
MPAMTLAPKKGLVPILGFAAVCFGLLWLLYEPNEETRVIAVMVPLTGDFTPKGHEHLRAAGLALRQTLAEEKHADCRSLAWRILGFDTNGLDRRSLILDGITKDLAETKPVATVGFHTSGELQGALKYDEDRADSPNSWMPLPEFIITPTATAVLRDVPPLRDNDSERTTFLRACPDSRSIARVLLDSAVEKASPGLPELRVQVLYESTEYGRDLRRAIEECADGQNGCASWRLSHSSRGDRAVVIEAVPIADELEQPERYEGPVIVAASHASADALFRRWQDEGLNSLTPLICSDGIFTKLVLCQLDGYFKNLSVVSLAPGKEKLEEYKGAYAAEYNDASPDGYGYWTWVYLRRIVSDFCGGEPEPLAAIVDEARASQSGAGGALVLNLNEAAQLHSPLSFEEAVDFLGCSD